MKLINFFFFIILLNSLTGTIAYFLCRLLVKIAERIGAVRVIYPLYLMVEIFYVVPICYLINRFRFYSRLNVHMSIVGDFFLGNRIIHIVIVITSIIWLIGVIWLSMNYIRKYGVFLWIKRKNLPFFNEVYKKMLKNCYPRENWKMTKLCTNFLLKSPCVMGTFRHELVLPDIPYGQKEMQIILMHEATHIAKKDNLWKKIALIIVIVNWFNLILRWYIYDLEKWADIACDIDVCNRFLGNHAKEYFRVMVNASVKGNAVIPPFVSQLSTLETIKIRMKYMKKWQVNGRKVWVSILLVIMLALGSVTPAFAASFGIVKLQSNWYQKTRTEATIKADIEEIELFEIPVGEVESQKWGNVVYFDEKVVEDLETQRYFECNIPGKTVVRSDTFSMRSGETITVSCYVDSDSMLLVGICRPDGSLMYVDANNQITQIFNCDSDGDYFVFIENIGDDQKIVRGYYIN